VLIRAAARARLPLVNEGRLSLHDLDIDPHSIPKPHLGPGRPLWVFGYGSLMWNPGFRYAERRPGLLRGYHRRFCVYSVHYRGTPEQPGLVLGLDGGGSCRGIVYRVAERDTETALSYLWERELITNVYRPRFLTVKTAEGTVEALCFVARRDVPDYFAERCTERAAHIIARAAGSRGANTEYLRNTLKHLDALAMPDVGLRRIWQQVLAAEKSRTN